MLIGQFCETYPPSLDGVGRVMLGYCAALARMGHRSVYVAPSNPAYPEAQECETLLYPGVPIPGESYRVGVPRLSRAFRKAAKDLPFDIVHAHSPFLAGREARRLARRLGVPLVATFHSKYYDDFYKATGSRVLARLGLVYVLRFYRSCDEVWAVNQRTAQVLRDYGYRGHIVAMPNGTNPLSVTPEQRNAALLQYPLREGVPTLIFAGQMDRKKNVEKILRACALLMRQGLDFQLLMVGAGYDAKAMRRLSGELGLSDRVLFTGFLRDRPTLLALYQRSDLLVFPSLYDNAPMVVREAAAMGTPALLVENTCSAEGIVHNDNGFLCQNTVESIAEAIVKALPHCAGVGARARDTIPIPWDVLIQQVVARYRRLIELKSHARPGTSGRSAP